MDNTNESNSTEDLLNKLSQPLDEEAASILIQKWFRKLPFRWTATQIINQHEKELDLLSIDLREREVFVQEVKRGDYHQISMRNNIAALALSALKANRINNDEASIIIEFSQLLRTYGIQNVHVLHFLDEKKQLTPAAQQIIKILFNTLVKEKILPIRLQRSNGDTLFEQEVHEKLQEEQTLYADLYYLIDQKDFVSEHKEDILQDFRALYTLEVLISPNRYFMPAYRLCDILGTVLYGKNWLKKEYRLGSMKRDDIRIAQERGVRPASISSETVHVPAVVHDERVSPVGYSRHDGYHRVQGSLLPLNIRKALARIQFIVRTQTAFEWSNELWAIEDRDRNFYNSDNSPGVSNELLFFLNIRSIISIEEIYRSGPKKIIWSQSVDEYCVRNKDKTSLILWIMVMDMVAHPELWRSAFQLDINQKELHFDHHIALYKSLKTESDFMALDRKQKLLVLEKTYHLYDIERQPYEDLDYCHAWEKFNEEFNILDEAEIEFKKDKKNSLYLDCPDMLKPQFKP